jgi:hypothetical protein
MGKVLNLLRAIYNNDGVSYGFGEGLTVPFLTGCCTGDAENAEARIRSLLKVILDEPLDEGFEFRLQSCDTVGEILALKRTRDHRLERMVQLFGMNVHVRAKNFPNVEGPIDREQLTKYLIGAYAVPIGKSAFSFDTGTNDWGDYSERDSKFIEKYS